MEIKTSSAAIIKSRSDAIVLDYYEDGRGPEGQTAVVDGCLEGAISQLVRDGDIKGKFKEINLIYSLGKLPVPKVVVVGLGKRKELNAEKIRVASAELVKYLRQKNVQTADLSVFSGLTERLPWQMVGQAIAEGVLLGHYTFRRHITVAPETKPVKRINLICPDSTILAGVEEGSRKGEIVATAANLARDLVNEPSNFMTPANLADSAAGIAKKYKLGIEVIEQKEMQKLGMGGLLGVAQGTRQPPKFIVLSYRGRASDDVDIALIGKGITFDSGGISIKPSEGMGDMKGDMAGGAAVLGTISAVAQLKPQINLMVLVPATENLPSGTAYKPGDIIRIMNGKTVEIVTTDAEGRLILADAISYALKRGIKRIVDVATLTGSCHIALGDYCTGAFTNNQEFLDRLVAAGKEAGECMWQMPMLDEYKELNKSDVADLKNSGGRYGGASSAAWFLGEFAANAQWIHLDIAGTSDTSKERGYLVKGATGVPVRTLVNFILFLAK
jgi:leucyl aminopeptidase